MTRTRAQPDKMYVIVNMTLGPGGTMDKWRYVLPSEEPHTYDNLKEACYAWLEIAQEHDHNIETLSIFKLEPVSTGEFEEALEGVLAEFNRDQEVME